MKLLKKNKNWIPITILIAIFIYDVFFFSSNHSGRKTSMDYVLDIRVIHQYTNYALGFISLILGLMIGRLDDVKKYVGVVDMFPFLIALASAGFCIIFIPVSYENEYTDYVRFYWICKIVLEQIVVVFTIHGLITISFKVQEAQKKESNT
jgi:hypothetical protein